MSSGNPVPFAFPSEGCRSAFQNEGPGSGIFLVNATQTVQHVHLPVISTKSEFVGGKHSEQRCEMGRRNKLRAISKRPATGTFTGI